MSACAGIYYMAFIILCYIMGSRKNAQYFGGKKNREGARHSAAPCMFFVKPENMCLIKKRDAEGQSSVLFL